MAFLFRGIFVTEFASDGRSTVVCSSPLSPLRRQKGFKIELTNVPRERVRQGASYRPVGSVRSSFIMSDRGDPSRVDRQGLKNKATNPSCVRIRKPT